MAHHIYIDGLFLHPHHQNVGISRYLVNLLREMGRIAATDSTLISVLVPPVVAANDAGLKRCPGLQWIPCRAMGLRRAWRMGLLLPWARAARAGTYFLPSPIPIFRKPQRLVVTIHDIIPLLFPEELNSFSDRFLRHAYRSSLHAADLILTDSAYSKHDLVGKQGISSDRVIVVHLGFDSCLFHSNAVAESEIDAVLSRYRITQPYILHVGTLDWRKNLVRLIQAYRRLLARRRDFALQLVLCGRTGVSSKEILEAIREPGQPGQVIATGPVPDADLSVLYRAAAACALPSLYEGFGLPLLEGMASGVPVMSSNASCLPEIAADSALYFGPESVEEMSDAMERLLSDSDLRKRLVARGRIRVGQFSWEACACTTLAALKSL